MSQSSEARNLRVHEHKNMYSCICEEAISLRTNRLTISENPSVILISTLRAGGVEEGDWRLHERFRGVFLPNDSATQRAGENIVFVQEVIMGHPSRWKEMRARATARGGGG